MKLRSRKIQLFDQCFLYIIGVEINLQLINRYDEKNNFFSPNNSYCNGFL